MKSVMLIEVLKQWFYRQLENQRMHYISIRGLKPESHIIVRDAMTDEILDIGKTSDSDEYRATIKMKDFTPLYNITVVKSGYQSLCVTASDPKIMLFQVKDDPIV